MMLLKPTISKLPLFLLSLFVFSFSFVSAQDGKALFTSLCASCHHPLKDGTGPALGGLEERHKWADHNELLAWVNNPGGYMAKDASGYTTNLKTRFGTMMTGFPALTIKDIDAIVSYINVASLPPPPEEVDNAKKETGSNNAIIFGVISIILAIIALILMQVNSNLKKMSDDAEGIQRPDPVPFFRNKIYIAMGTVILFIIGGYFATKAAIGLQREKDYEPVQPIYYSHKVHAGINQINCLYCHGNAYEGKSATVPSVNVCMNCHKTITSYDKGPKLYDRNGKEINGTAEIAKVHKAAGFDPAKPNDWDPSKAKPIEWVRIHSLPDHVYFNHSQHTRAGKVQCQTCHGNIPEMDEVKQFSELSMGWCVNCHRETKVDFNYNGTSGNKFYSIYEKFHNDIKSGKMDSVTVKDIGGLECQKCHY